jgi:NADPH2:quinone reductase
MVFPLPEPLDFAQGAGLIMNYHTAHFALVRRANVQQAETVLVLGAAGGIGTAALQVAKALGTRTIAAVSSAEKEVVARAAGADEVVRTDEAWGDAVMALTQDKGADVIIDPVGGSDDQLRATLRCLAPEGRLVIIGFAAGHIPSIGLNRLLFRNVSILGAAWGAFAFGRPDYLHEVAIDLDKMANQGFVKPLIGKQYTIEQVPEALRDLEQRRATGKLVMING